MLFYGLTEEEYFTVIGDRGWGCFREDGEVAFMQTFMTSAGEIEATIGCEDIENSNETWEVVVTMAGTYNGKQTAVTGLVATIDKAEILAAEMDGEAN